MDKGKEKQQLQQQQKQQIMDQMNGNTSVVATPSNKTKEKRRSNEKRKEKSRDAARCRRSRETEIFNELAHVLPLRREDVEQLDKASVMRLSIAFLKIRDMLKLFPKIKDIKTEDELVNISTNQNGDKKEIKLLDLLNSSEAHKLLMPAIDGFLLMLSGDGDVTYVSDNISDYLGISQIDLLGQQIWEYSHQCDHDELKEALNMRDVKNDNQDLKSNENNKNKNVDENHLKTAHRDFYIRLKCTLTSRGRSVNIKSASYKVIHMTGHIIWNPETEQHLLVAIGRPLPHPSNIEIPFESTTFLTKHSLDMKFTYVDDNMLSLLGYRPEDLLDKSLYNCYYAADSESLMQTFKSVLHKGQGETHRYRFLGKNGGYAWVVTQATIVYDKQKPQSVVCVNYAISNLENNNEIYSFEQFEATNKNIDNNNCEKEENKSNQCENYLESLQNKQEQQKELTGSLSTIPQQILPTTVIKTCYQQQHQQQQQQKPKILLQNSILSKPSTAVTVTNTVIDNSNASTINVNNCCDGSLSPIRNTFNKCSVSVTKSVTTPSKPSVIFGTSSVTASIIKPIETIGSQSYQRGGPKTVTASVFKKAPLTKVTFLPKPQSVTTSVFTQISSLRKNQQQQQQQQQSTTRLFGASGPGTLIKSFNKLQQQNQQRSVEDMNKGFSMFLDDPTELTMLKEEPDDLTHLAPSAGDACIPLDDSTPLFGEMLDGLMLPDSYGSLLPDDINSLDSQQSNNQTTTSNQNNNKNHIDPFINYRDESSDTTGSPNLLSPSGASKSPEASSIPSLCSPNSLSQEDEFAFMTMNDEIDLTMRAPYIPMNEQDDLPLLTEDLMWSAFTEELHKDIKEALQIEIKNNSINNSLNNLNSCINNNNNNNSNNNNNNSNNNSFNTSLNSTTTRSSSQSPPLNCNSNINNNNNNVNNTNCNSSNNNGVNNESSLAALLCRNNLMQQQSQQNMTIAQDNCNNRSNCNNSNSNSTIMGQQTIQNHQNIDELSKKRKFELNADNLTTSGDLMVDSIDAFGQVFNKNSLNLDCWTINDLLQINPESSTQTENLLRQKPMIINTAATTNFNVPLISVLQQQQQQQQNLNKINLTRSSSIGSINNNPTTMTTTKCINSNNSNTNNDIIGHQQQQQHHIIDDQCNNKKLNNMTSRLLTTAIPIPIKQNSPIQSNMNNGNEMLHCNKRHLSNVSTSLDSKRIKNNSSATIELQTSPQLLQQLMAPTPQKQKMKSIQSGKWNQDDNDGNSSSQQQQHQAGTSNNNNNNTSMSTTSSTPPSNSVLKNLLVSGCDNAFSPGTPSSDISPYDDSSRDSMCQTPDHLRYQLSSSSNINANYTKPLNCKIMNLAQLTRFCNSNPMFGGSTILPSPPILIPSQELSADNENFSNFIKNNVQNGSNQVNVCQLNYQQNSNQNNSSTNNTNGNKNDFMKHSSKFMPLNDSDSDSGIDCGASRNYVKSLIGNYASEFLSKSTNSNLSKLPLNSNCGVCNDDDDDTMSSNDDEAPPPLESTELSFSTPLSAAIYSNNPSIASALSPQLTPMTTTPTPPPLSMSSVYSPSPILGKCCDEQNDREINCCNNTINDDNPLGNSTFYMDLCSDDYVMTDLLQDNEISKVLNDWNHELIT